MYDIATEHRVQSGGVSIESANRTDKVRIGNGQKDNSVKRTTGKLSSCSKHSSINKSTSSGSSHGFSLDNPAYDAQDDEVFFSPPSGAVNPCYSDPDDLNNHNYEACKAEHCITAKPQLDLNDLEVFEKLPYENRTVY